MTYVVSGFSRTSRVRLKADTTYFSHQRQFAAEVVSRLSLSACGHAEPRTSTSEARHQRQFAAGVGPRRQ